MSDILVIIQVAIMFLIGLVFLFEGYKIERIIITILWFVLGFNIAKDVLGMFNYSVGVVPIVIEVIVGLCFASVGFKLERIAFFIAVAYAAFIAIPNYFVLENSILFFAVRVLVAVAVGLLAIKFRALIYTLIASFLGATLMKRAIFILFPSLSPGIVTAINIGVIVLVVIGILSQIQEYGRAS